MVMGASTRCGTTLEHLIAQKTCVSHSERTFIASLKRIFNELWYRPQPGRAAAKNVVDVDEWDMRGWVDLGFICLIPFLGSFGFRWTIIMTKVISRFERDIARRYGGSHSTACLLFEWFAGWCLRGWKRESTERFYPALPKRQPCQLARHSWPQMLTAKRRTNRSQAVIRRS